MPDLSPHIHVAVLDQRVVILDTHANRYRLVTGRKAQALAALAAGHAPIDRTALAALTVEHIIGDASSVAASHSVTPPRRSALEYADPATVEFAWTELAVAAAATSIRLRLTRFDRLLAWTCAGIAPRRAVCDATLIRLAHAFDRGRIQVPIHRVCLHDAILLARMLGRRGIAHQLVFGVRLDPFGAHCWVQTGDLVLTGMLATAREVTPILVL